MQLIIKERIQSLYEMQDTNVKIIKMLRGFLSLFKYFLIK